MTLPYKTSVEKFAINTAKAESEYRTIFIYMNTRGEYIIDYMKNDFTDEICIAKYFKREKV